jgi:chromosome condensin MukBEF MukE localization factor
MKWHEAIEAAMKGVKVRAKNWGYLSYVKIVHGETLFVKDYYIGSASIYRLNKEDMNVEWEFYEELSSLAEEKKPQRPSERISMGNEAAITIIAEIFDEQEQRLNDIGFILRHSIASDMYSDILKELAIFRKKEERRWL